MVMNVFMPGEWPDGLIRRISNLVPEGVRIETGEHPHREGFQILITGRPTKAQIESSPVLRWLFIPWAGLPQATAELMKSYPQVEVHNIHHNAGAVAEMTIGLLIAAARKILPADLALRKGNWSHRYHRDDAVLVEGNRALIVGYGEIGSRVASILRAMGARVDAVRRSQAKREEKGGVAVHPPSSLLGLIPGASFVILTCPLTSETAGIIGDEELTLMSEKTVLVNVGRAELIQEKALFSALMTRKIRAAALDVWYQYPKTTSERTHTLPAIDPFWNLDNVVMSPHLGAASGVPALEKRQAEQLAVLISAAAQGSEIPWKVDLNLGY
jgi:phosphoglycerate dehydrogenase-like enzyme